MARRCGGCGEEIDGPDTHECRTRSERRPGEAPQAGDLLAGRYFLVEQAGKGGGGVVFRAYDRELDVQVGIKVLPPGEVPEGLLLRFKREIRITRDIDHPNVSRVFDLGRSDGLTFLSMRWIDGEPLSARVERDGPLAKRELSRLAAGLVAALAETHRRGVVHRDVKPANVMVSRSGEPVLVDFGIATVAAGASSGGADGEPITLAGAVPGTPMYMAPELAEGGPTKPTADLWGLGLTLAFAATGQTGRPSEPERTFRGLGRTLGGTLVRCLDPSPLRRPIDAAAIESALRASSRLRWAIAIGALALAGLALAGATGLFVARRSAPPSSMAAVVVEPLENRTGDRSLDWMERGVADLVAASIESSGRVRIATGARSSRRAAHIGGRIVKSGDAVAVDLVLSSPDGERRARAHVEAGRSLLTGVDDAAGEFLRVLGFRAPRPERSREVPAPLTADYEAFAAFARARDLIRGHHDLAALDELRRATDRDPGFALAHLERYTVMSYGRHGSRAEAALALQMARTHRGRLPPTERELLDAIVATIEGGDVDRLRAWLRTHAAESSTYLMAFRAMPQESSEQKALLEEWATKLPRDPEPHNQLGYILLIRFSDAAGAEREFKEAIRLAPNEPNGYDSYGFFLSHQGRFDEALRAYDRAVAIEPGFAYSAIGGVDIAIQRDDLADADRRLERVDGLLPVDSAPFEAWVAAKAAVALLAGDDAQALRRLDQIARAPRTGSRAYVAYEYEAIVRAVRGETAEARRAAATAERLRALYHGGKPVPTGLGAYVAGITAYRHGDRATLERAAHEIEGDASRAEVGSIASERAKVVTAFAEALAGRPGDAADHLAEVEGIGGLRFFATLERARLLDAAGRVSDADAAYEAAMVRRDDGIANAEVAASWRALLAEVARRARARGDEARAAAAESRLARLH